MSKNPENTTSVAEGTVASQQDSKQGGIPLRSSEPLRHNPFVHVTLDAAERPRQVEPESAPPVAQPMPFWAQQRFFGHAPERSSRVARTFPKQDQAASTSQVQPPVQGSSQAPSQAAGAPGVPGAQAPRFTPRTDIGHSESKADSPTSSPALRVVLEQEEPKQPSEVSDGVEGKVEIGNDHISVPSDIYAQDELNDLAANMPLIPKNLIFGKNSAAMPQGGGSFNQGGYMGAYAAAGQTGNFAQPNGSFASTMPTFNAQAMPAGSQAGPRMVANMANSAYLQGNPRNAFSPAGGGYPGANSISQGGAALSQNHSAPLNQMPHSAEQAYANGYGASHGISQNLPNNNSINFNSPASDGVSHITPSVVAVPPSTDYRLYAANAMGDAHNPLRPHTPTPIDPASSQMAAWRSQSDMGGSAGFGASNAFAQQGAQGAASMHQGSMPSANSPSLSAPYGSSAQSSAQGGFNNSQPLDAMRSSSARPNSASQSFGVSPSEQTLPSGMPVSFDSPRSRTSAPSNPNNSIDLGTPIRPGAESGLGSAANRSGSFSAPRGGSPSAFPSNGDKGVPLDAGTPIPRGSLSKPSTPESKPKSEVSETSLFDQPPVPIVEGMKNADTSHKKLRRLITIILVVVVLVLGGIVGYLVWSGTVKADQLVPHITIEAPGDNSSEGSGSSGSSGGSSDTSGSSSSADASGSSGSSGSSDDAGSVVYQYTALTSDGTAYTVEETATFSDDGYCEFTTMKMKFPDAEKAKAFTDNLARDYGNSFTLDVLDGANATVTIDNSSLRLDRERYEESLRYSVEDLVILKK